MTEPKETKILKGQLNERLIISMKKNNLPTLNISSGQFQYKQKMVPKPLNKKDILTILLNNSILSDTQMDEVNICLKENRTKIMKESIVYNNNK